MLRLNAMRFYLYINDVYELLKWQQNDFDLKKTSPFTGKIACIMRIYCTLNMCCILQGIWSCYLFQLCAKYKIYIKCVNGDWEWLKFDHLSSKTHFKVYFKNVRYLNNLTMYTLCLKLWIMFIVCKFLWKKVCELLVQNCTCIFK